MHVNLITRARNTLMVEFRDVTDFTLFFKKMERRSHELVEIKGQDQCRIWVRPSDIEVVEVR